MELGTLQSKVKVWDGTEIILVNADGSINSVVTATDLDIRDLTSAQDDVSVTTVKPDGTNTMPSLDTVARAGFVKITDGVETALVDANGNLNVSPTEYFTEVAKGNVTGSSIVNKFGAAHDFDTGDGEVLIWDASDDSITYDNNDASKYLKATWGTSTTADIGILSCAAAGTQTIEIQGIGTDDALLVQTFTLNGTTDVDLSATGTDYKRIFRMKNTGTTDLGGHVWVRTNGSAQDAGTPGVPGDAATIRGMIHEENNQTEMACYTVPTACTTQMHRLYTYTSGGSRVTNYIVRLYARSSGGVYQLKWKGSISDDSSAEVLYKLPPTFAAETDLIMTAETTESAITGSSVIAGFDLLTVAD